MTALAVIFFAWAKTEQCSRRLIRDSTHCWPFPGMATGTLIANEEGTSPDVFIQ